MLVTTERGEHLTHTDRVGQSSFVAAWPPFDSRDLDSTAGSALASMVGLTLVGLDGLLHELHQIGVALRRGQLRGGGGGRVAPCSSSHCTTSLQAVSVDSRVCVQHRQEG